MGGVLGLEQQTTIRSFWITRSFQLPKRSDRPAEERKKSKDKHVKICLRSSWTLKKFSLVSIYLQSTMKTGINAEFKETLQWLKTSANATALLTDR